MSAMRGSTKLPHVVVHVAVSLDGQTKGFSPDVAEFYRLAAYWGEDATLVGSRTILDAPEGGEVDRADSPAAWPDSARSERPLLVIVDSGARVRCWGALSAAGIWKSAVSLGSEQTSAGHLDYLHHRGVQSLIAGVDRVHLRKALERLQNDFGVGVLRVDSGGVLNGILLDEGLVSEVSLLVHPVLIGGTETRYWLGSGRGGNRTTAFALIGSENVSGQLVWMRYRVEQS